MWGSNYGPPRPISPVHAVLLVLLLLFGLDMYLCMARCDRLSYPFTLVGDRPST